MDRLDHGEMERQDHPGDINRLQRGHQRKQRGPQQALDRQDGQNRRGEAAVAPSRSFSIIPISLYIIVVFIAGVFFLNASVVNADYVDVMCGQAETVTATYFSHFAMQIVVVRFSGRTSSPVWSAQYNSENMKGARVGCERKRKRKVFYCFGCQLLCYHVVLKYMHPYLDESVLMKEDGR